jgi:hypothetical protein
MSNATLLSFSFPAPEQDFLGDYFTRTVEVAVSAAVASRRMFASSASADLSLRSRR